MQLFKCMPIYISQKGLEELKAEMADRKTAMRRTIAEEISEAKELGDLSENFEYQDAKERQGLNEARIVQLESMIHDAVIVDSTQGGEQITLGSTFTVECNGVEQTYSMVGSTEADPLSGKISNESPIGIAFIGQKAGDEVVVDAPSGKIVYKILRIK